MILNPTKDSASNSNSPVTDVSNIYTQNGSDNNFTNTNVQIDKCISTMIPSLHKDAVSNSSYTITDVSNNYGKDLIMNTEGSNQTDMQNGKGMLSPIPIASNISVIGKSRTMEDLVHKTTESASKFLTTASDMDIIRGPIFGTQLGIWKERRPNSHLIHEHSHLEHQGDYY